MRASIILISRVRYGAILAPSVRLFPTLPESIRWSFILTAAAGCIVGREGTEDCLSPTGGLAGYRGSIFAQDAYGTNRAQWH